MEQKYDNTNRGALFKNDKKTEEKQPDYTGTINANGVECWLSAWLKKSKEGKTYMSLSITPKTPIAGNGATPDTKPEGDIPF